MKQKFSLEQAIDGRVVNGGKSRLRIRGSDDFENASTCEAPSPSDSSRPLHPTVPKQSKQGEAASPTACYVCGKCLTQTSLPNPARQGRFCVDFRA
jgi:hypothetical protein